MSPGFFARGRRRCNRVPKVLCARRIVERADAFRLRLRLVFRAAFWAGVPKNRICLAVNLRRAFVRRRRLPALTTTRRLAANAMDSPYIIGSYRSIDTSTVQLEPVMVAALVSVMVFVPRVTAMTGATVPALEDANIMITMGDPLFCPCCVGVEASGMFML